MHPAPMQIPRGTMRYNAAHTHTKDSEAQPVRITSPLSPGIIVISRPRLQKSSDET